jgi:hypothetical protein
MTPESRRWIGLGQVIGAAVGIVGLRFGAVLVPGLAASAPLILASAYFLVALAGGWLLLRHRPSGVPLSFGVQAAQVLSVTVGGNALHFLAGPFAGVWAGGAGVGVNVAGGGVAAASILAGPLAWLPGVQLQFGLNYRSDDPTALTFGLNVLALVACAKLWRAMDVALPEPSRTAPQLAEEAAPGMGAG